MTTFSDYVNEQGTADRAVNYLNQLLLAGTVLQPEPISDAEEHEVWDGSFELVGSDVFYVGADGPSGGTKQVRRQQIFHDTIIETF